MRQYLENSRMYVQSKLLMTNRKLHMSFRLTTRPMTLNELLYLYLY